jgi:16S rRNA (cytosine967-C5)-methyltransferase
LPEENGDQIAALTAHHPEYAVLPWRQAWAEVGTEPPSSASSDAALLLTPARHHTDGFFIASLTRAA